ATLVSIVMSRETETDVLQNNYVKAGFGTQWSTYLDMHLSNGRSEKIYYGFNIFHHSARGAEKFKNFADNRYDAMLKFPGKKIAATLQGGYTGHSINYYVYDFSDSLIVNSDNNALRNRYATVDASFAIENSVP